MALEFRFPDVGEGITEGHIVKWMVKEGDVVKQDQPIGKIETDKAVVEIPAPRAGVILKINAKEGDTVRVGDLIVTIGDKGEKLPARIKEPAKPEPIKPSIPKTVSQPKKEFMGVVGELEEAREEIPAKPVQQKPETIPQKPQIPTQRKTPVVKALPKTRKLAKDLGVDITKIQGSGPDGVITEDDVRRFSGNPAPATSQISPHQVTTITSELAAPKVTFDKYGRVLEIPITNIRKKIAENMSRSVYTAPHAVEMDEADITNLAKIREREKKRLQELGIHLTYLPFIIKALIPALQKHPYVNSVYDQESGIILNKQYYNIGVAVDTPYGLMVPVVKHADRKSILDIAHEIEVLAEQARTREISLEDLKGGTFTITNYGSLGGMWGVPIINYPETAILGVGRIADRPVVKDNKIVIRKMAPLSLAFDHRVIDGAQAARFLTTLIEHLQDPDFMLLDMD